MVKEYSDSNGNPEQAQENQQPQEPAPQTSNDFHVYEQVDCIDERGIWMNGEILEMKDDEVLVHYTGFAKKFDRWIPLRPSHILKQWRYGQNFQINNRIDVVDTRGVWIEAYIIDQNPDQIKVHFRRFAPKWDEWLSKNSTRIAEIGSKSQAYGIGKSDPQGRPKFFSRPIQEIEQKPQLPQHREENFQKALSENQFIIFPAEADGNCLFRSVSHQLYGSTQFHGIIREKVVEYINIEKDYFSQFVVGGLEGFGEYLTHISRNGAWGDDLEIQAMSEMYDRPIEIYAYSGTPMRTFHEQQGNLSPIRVSYHGQSHYNSVISSHSHQPLLQDTPPGTIEEEAVQRARSQMHNQQLLDARMDFDRRDQLNLERALEISLQEADDPEYNEAIQKSLMEDQDLNDAMQQSLLNQEDILLQQALEESQKEHQILHQFGNNEEELLKMIMEQSLRESNQSQAVREVMQNGFTLDQALRAQSFVGDDALLMIDFIMSNLM